MTTVVVSGKDLAAATARVVKLIKVSDTGMQGSLLVEYTGAKLRVTGSNTHARLSVNMPVLEGDPQPESCVVPGKLLAGLSNHRRQHLTERPGNHGPGRVAVADWMPVHCKDSLVRGCHYKLVLEHVYYSP